MTYGTGTSPGMQTITDVVGITALSPEKKEPIEYSARAPIVAPPVATLPPPSSGGETAVAANWPNDPDELDKQFRADAAARAERGEPIPNYRLPPREREGPEPILLEDSFEGPATMSKEQIAETRKMFADARGNVSVDENGNPVRKYLTEPPVEYRAPDPDAPVEITEKPKKRKWKWPWEK
jgi:hypothetical protein